MGIKKYKPTTDSLRWTALSDFSEITKTTPEKSLLLPLKKSGGRNSYGRITSRHRGGGHKRQLRIIDFLRDKLDVTAKVIAIEYDPNRSARIARSAGNSCVIMAKEGGFAHVKLPSGEIRLIGLDCFATIGQVGNIEHEAISIGKAGRSRWMGKRPYSRGVAKNPHDHPMGGGEGKASGGLPRSPTGQYAKGLKTRHHKKHSNKYIVKRRK